MSLYDLIIRAGTVVTATDSRPADVAVADGRIVAVAPSIEGTARAEIDATGLSVFPGAVDTHVHFNDPGRAEWEGFASGTRAFAAGGGTTYGDMPLNARPPTLDAASFDRKLAVARAASLVDFAFWGGLVPGNLDRLEELAARGVLGFKAFMSATGMDDFPRADDETLRDGMARAARLGRIVAVHAEDEEITGELARRAIAAGRTGVRDYLASRPVAAELAAIARAILLAEETGCALHIVHVSTGHGVDLVAEARLRGVDVSCETCAHYLAFTEDDVERLGAVAKCAPPLRPQVEQDALWRHIADRTLSMVTSDHSPAAPELKAGPDFFGVWGGILGCQSTLAVLLTEGYAARGLAPATIATLLAGYAARRFRLPGKGWIGVGADADLALVDLGHEGVLAAGDLFYRHRHSPYVGRSFRGRVVRTLLRGCTVFLDGRIVAEPAGQLLRPEPAAPGAGRLTGA